MKMAGVIYEDFLRCPHCNNFTFEEKKVVVLSKNAEKRLKKEEKLPLNSLYFTYVCQECGMELDL